MNKSDKKDIRLIFFRNKIMGYMGMESVGRK